MFRPTLGSVSQLLRCSSSIRHLQKSYQGTYSNHYYSSTSSSSGGGCKPKQAASSEGTFIDRIRANGVNVLLNEPIFNQGPNKYDSLLKGLKLLQAEPGRVECTITVTPEVENAWGALHGACTGAMVDITSTIALMTIDPTRPITSVESSISFTRAARRGATIFVDTKVLKYDDLLGFTQVDVFMKDKKGNRVLVATARHTKEFPSAAAPPQRE